MKLATITKDNNQLYLTQEIDTNNIYEKAKTIVNFCDKETKLFEKEIDRAILDIFSRNGIEIPNTKKSVLKLAFGWLKDKGKEIVITNVFTQTYMGCILVRKNDLFNVYMENDNGKEILQCGVCIEERNIQ
jgi:hypothetical protein